MAKWLVSLITYPTIDSRIYIHVSVYLAQYVYMNNGFIFLHTQDDSSRVCLTEVSGVEGSDYINASFITVGNIFLILESSVEYTCLEPLYKSAKTCSLTACFSLPSLVTRPSYKIKHMYIIFVGRVWLPDYSLPCSIQSVICSADVCISCCMGPSATQDMLAQL